MTIGLAPFHLYRHASGENQVEGISRLAGVKHTLVGRNANHLRAAANQFQGRIVQPGQKWMMSERGLRVGGNHGRVPSKYGVFPLLSHAAKQKTRSFRTYFFSTNCRWKLARGMLPAFSKYSARMRCARRCFGSSCKARANQASA